MQAFKQKRIWVPALACLVAVAVCIFGFFLLSDQDGMLRDELHTSGPFLSFEGVYRVGSDPWKTYEEGVHIPSTAGEVRLRGRFYQNSDQGKAEPLGKRIYFRLNHLHATFDFGIEKAVSGEGRSDRGVCGDLWMEGFVYPETSPEEVEILLTNPHIFGNAAAVDEFLSSAYAGDRVMLEALLTGESVIGSVIALMLLMLAAALTGFSCFAVQLSLPQRRVLWALSALLLCASAWYYFSAKNALFYTDSSGFFATGLELSRMLYGLSASVLTLFCLDGRSKRIGAGMVCVLGGAVALMVIIAAVGKCNMYDMLLPWVLLQGTVGIGILVLCMYGIAKRRDVRLFFGIAGIAAVLAMLADICALCFSWYGGNLASNFLFLSLLACTFVVILWTLPFFFREAARAKALEEELDQSQSALLLSQIHPHFLFNSLTAIRSLCRQDPEKAWLAIGDFAAYLRSNMNSLSCQGNIPFSTERKHIEAYLRLEKMRMGNRLKVVYDIQEQDFFLPPLTIQPLVENAVNHGIGPTKDGGTVTLRTYSENGQTVILVADNGVGFDPANHPRGDSHRPHIGIKNIRRRLKKIPGSTLEVSSIPGKGTVAMVRLNITEGAE